MNSDQVVEYKGVRIVVQRATARIGTKRSVLSYRGAEQAAQDPEEVAVLRTITYPDLTAPVREASGTIELEAGRSVDFSSWPVSFEDFCELPDDLIWAWEKTVYDVNPHWSPSAQIQAEAEKKIERSTDA